jgi:hypothetical protein
MFTTAILTIPALVVPLVLAPERDCQFGRVGDPDADEHAVIAFEMAVDEYGAIHRWSAHPWPLPKLGAFFTPAAADVFRRRIAAAIREGKDEEGGVLSVLPTLPFTLDYRIVGSDLVLFDVCAQLAVDTLENALPLVPAPVETEEEGPAAPDEEPPPGCLYSQLPI